MSYFLDEEDLDRSHELERRLDRDEEREPYGYRRPRRRTLYPAGSRFRRVANTNHVAISERNAA
jgi:hypothetical protein